MDQQRRNDVRRGAGPGRHVLVESLEFRRLLSAAIPAAPPLPPPPPPPPVFAPYTPADGYSAAQMRHAYGFDQVTFNHGTVPGDGRGQTIAIVDPNDNPSIMSDLNVFDTQFGLPAPPSFQVINQTGDSTPAPPDMNSAGEIALDVEWAHAIAPMANLVLVEANSLSSPDLNQAIDEARRLPNVSVISMSFGGSEFFQFNGIEGNQLDFDALYTTPPGHQGETFIASAGDSSTMAGVSFPASSPNVISVGGTSLYLRDAAGTYGTETYWSGTNSGYSNVEAEPRYQEGAQDTGFRNSPDVTYNADMVTGVAVFSDFAFGGWTPVGGTSAGAPQWSALVAIANQGRVLNGLGTLDGASQTLPILYGLYSPPFTPGYASYTNYFNDVNEAGSPIVTWRWGGSGFNDRIPVQGYDSATGLGSPKAQNLIPALATLSAPPVSPVTAAVVTPPVAAGMGGKKATFKVRVTNASMSMFDAPVTLNINASPATGTAAVMPVDSVSIGTVRLNPGASKVMKVRFFYPFTLPSGKYNLSGSLFTPSSDTTPAPVKVTTTPVTVAQPMVDLAISPGSAVPVLVRPGATSVAAITITNVGNIPADGFANLLFYASKSKTLDSTATLLPSVPGHKIRLRPGKSVTFRESFYAPSNMAGGSYYILAKMISSTQPADANAANDVTALTTRAS